MCGHCLQKPPPWDAIDIRWQFEGLNRHLIHQFKYHRNLPAGQALVDRWLANKTDLPLPEALIAVPMHRLKLFDKGYNHADLLTKKLSRTLKVPYWSGINRIVETPPLEGLSKKERRSELKGAFSLTKKPPESVALIDDVFTTGATASEITRLLKRNGCKHVTVWALARTPLN